MEVVLRQSICTVFLLLHELKMCSALDQSSRHQSKNKLKAAVKLLDLINHMYYICKWVNAVCF